MVLTAYAAWWFLPAVLPIAIYVAWSDMQRMKIPNVAVYALVGSFAILGLIALPFPQYLWHWTHLIIMLLIGIALNAARVMGAGDAKFIAGAAPFVALGDLRLVIALLSACLLAGYVTHRLVRMSPLRRMVPDWESWTSGRKFPMGFPLSMTILFYLLLVAVYR
ncbi:MULTISPECIES: A24 family peptidase [unclassified Yoonia]|uniref:A24 family peptidase n=1 Tax=unclassified Yoonia TaxID=2629118 RepID=UPI002AFDFDB7|nr:MULTISPECIES: prepilin peptidase [unclassified Yoonia]